MKKILVTGGAGYIGSHVCKALSKQGFLPVTFDNLINGHEWAVKWGPLEIGDINDKQTLEKILRMYEPEAVMHFAAHAYVGESVHSPHKYYSNNVCGSLTLLEAMRNCNLNKIIFSSSCATYGHPLRLPITEELEQKPINPYGITKHIVEIMLKDFEKAYGLESISLRYFNAAGADIDGEIGEVHNPETHLIPLILAAAAGHTSHVDIFGDDYNTRDGTCVRDFIHVSDLAEAHIKALNQILSGKKSSYYNLGIGHGFTVKEIIASAERITKTNISIKISPRRDGDPAMLVCNADKAKRELDWSPSLSDIENIINSAWVWYRKNFI